MRRFAVLDDAGNAVSEAAGGDVGAATSTTSTAAATSSSLGDVTVSAPTEAVLAPPAPPSSAESQRAAPVAALDTDSDNCHASTLLGGAEAAGAEIVVGEDAHANER